MMTLSCQTKKSGDDNPFFEEWTTPFGVPPFDRIVPQHYAPAFDRAISTHDAEIDAIVSNNDAPTFANVVVAYDASGALLSRVSLVFDMVSSADNNDELKAVQEQIMPKLAAHSDKILLNEKLFAKVKTLYEQRTSLSLNPVQLRLLEKTYDKFVRAGANLDVAQKERLKQINEELSLLGVKYGNNLLAENAGFRLELSSNEMDGIPSGVRDAASEKAIELGLTDKMVFTLDKPSLLPFLTYSSRRDLREKLYKAYISRGNNGNEQDNKQLINDFIRLRVEKAQLLGFESYAAYVIADQMAKTPDAVYAQMDAIWTPALDLAKKELEEMKPMLEADVPGATFESWDWWYYAEKVRKQKYALDEEMLRPYFSLENVQSGIFFLANRLYGITFRPISVPVYNAECMAFEVLDANESHLGVLYFDFYPRSGKNGGAWCGYFNEQSYKDGKRVAPVVGIVCNFTRPTQTTPALLTLDETGTMFHEFGHALHFLFHDVPYRGLSEVEGDFVELPSQIMENWAFEPELLSHYATNYQSQQVIPDYLVGRLRESGLFNQGFMTTELLASALSDLDIHSTKKYTSFDVNAFEKNALNEKRGLISQIEPRYHYPYFSHIFNGGYASGYYFYLWAEVLDKDAFQYFKESGDVFNRKIADAFRREVLSRGGSADGMTLYRNFRGQEPSNLPMLKGRGLWTDPEPTEEIKEEEGLQVKQSLKQPLANKKQ
ncbi:MAG: M3 family metallopeptidase [Alistipes sp.]